MGILIYSQYNFMVVKQEMKAQTRINPIDLWLDTVAYSKSGSPNTQRNYRRNFQKFLAFIGKTAEQLFEDYGEMKDAREFKRKYARLVKAWIGSLNRDGLTKGSIRTMVGVVQSFFKYNDLPLGFVPTAQASSEYHNRDIEKSEIAHLLAISRARDRAFFAVMAQSGLRPHELCKLQLKHLHPDLYHGTIPCKLEIPKEIAKGKYHGYFTFIGQEAVKYLKGYLKSRANLTPESFLFTKHGSEEPATPKSFGHKFERNIRKLKAKGLLDFNQKQKGKPSELRLYGLRKFFRKFASQAGTDFVNFWMGHTLGVDAHYLSHDPEFHRQQYKEKALPFLRIEKETPTETEQTINELRRELEQERSQREIKDKEIAQLRDSLAVLTPLLEFAQRNPGALQEFLSKLAPEEKRALQVALKNRQVRWLSRTIGDKNVSEKAQAVARKHRETLWYM